MDEQDLKKKNNNGNNNFKKKSLPEKKFELRNSLLTDLKESNPHIRTVHHIFVATLICLFVNTVAHDFFKKGTTDLGIQLIFSAFRAFHIAMMFWLFAVISTFVAYYVFNIWAHLRLKLPPKSDSIKILNTISIAVLISYYLFSFQTASWVVTTFNLQPASTAVVVLEQARLLMKVHSFVRHNAGIIVKYKTHSDQVLNLPGFSKFLYFLFAPTLIYRDEYPRTSKISWKFVSYRLFEVAGVIYYLSFLFYRFVIPVYEDFGKRKFTRSEIILAICESSISGILIFVSGFYVTLHSVQNVFAEILKFGDREFYREWWTCNRFSDYFRLWNILVYDWLYTYVYKDIYELVIPSKLVAKLTVFIISAVVHEWALSHIVGFFYPVLFMEFFFGGAMLTFIKTPNYTALNIYFWYSIMFGFGSLISLYSIEYFARLNVPIQNPTWINTIIPRWLTCDCIE